MSNLLVAIYEDGGCQFKTMVAMLSDDSWFDIMAQYQSLDHAKIIMNDFIANVRESATLDVVLLDWNCS
ncbi:hypothetical protein H4J59_01025 [Colwellia sp. MB02u-10]|jgi:hypothetical protein|uniref:hypothetical protein n=1 Tax=Colwellia sp. MB02u-10 TaxID=2759828 RepID=UPI0015F55F9C|nr:hypothetical protein [Colwellia sp. MB02u-10]MBA6339597.1 hypothetical protein [Colwellia sp. MB02u-10]